MNGEELFCYSCNAMRSFILDGPHQDFDDKGELEIRDYTCKTCSKRIRQIKRIKPL